MKPNTTAHISFWLSLAAAAASVLIAAAQPQNGWQWAQFVAGILMAMYGPIKQTWTESPRFRPE